MKANPLIINWHESNSPIYSADFQKGDKGRLATGAGDNNVRVRRSVPCEIGEDVALRSSH
jgi:chromatin assembly factor 1 subunit B